MASLEELLRQAEEQYSTSKQSGGSTLEEMLGQAEEEYSEENTRERREAVSSWADRYDDIVGRFSQYDTERNGGYTTDVGGGMSEEIDALISDFDGIREYAKRMGLLGADGYYGNLKQIRDHIRSGNEMMSQFSGEAEYNRWMSAPKKDDGSIDFRAMAQQMADELAAYESSAEYQGSLPYAARNNQQNTGGGNTYGAMASAPQAGAEDQTEEGTKYQELKRMADYYAMMADMEENRAKMEADMAQLESWSEEDKRLLEEWIDTRPGGFASMVEGILASSSGALLGAAHSKQFFSYRIFAKLAAKYGKDTVRRMADSYSRYRNQQVSEAASAAAENGAQGVWGGIVHSGLSVLASTAASITAPLGAIDSMLYDTGHYSTLDPNNMGTVLNTYGGKVRETVSQNILGENPNFGNKAWATVYQAGMSVLDNLARIAASGGTEAGALALAGLGSFGQSVAEASANGANPQQAAMLGLISGASEVVTEKIGLDKLFRTAEYAPESLGQVIKEALKQSGSEIMEEEITFLVGLASEAMILRDQSPYKMRVAELMYGGMSYDEAVSMANQELGQEAWDTALQSALSGFMMSLPASAHAEVTDRQNRPIRNQYAQQAEARLTELGVAEDQVENLARAIARQHMGYDLSRKDANLIKGSQAAQDVLGEFQESDPLRKLAEEAAAEQAGATVPQEASVQAKTATAETAPTQTKAAQTVTQAAQQTAKAEPEIDESWMDFDVNAPAQPAQAKAAPQETAQQTAPQEDDGGDDAEFFKTMRELDSILEADPDIQAKPSRDARLLSGGKAVQVAGVESTSGGKLTLKLTDGSTAAYSDMAFANAADARVYSTIEEMGISADEANILLERYYLGGVNGVLYAHGIQEAFNYGKSRMTQQDAMTKGSFTRDLLPMQVEAAYQIGFEAGQTERENQRTQRPTRRIGNAIGKKGSVTVKASVKGISKMQKVSIEVLKVLEEATGINIVVDTNLQDNANGEYDPATNTMTIDLNAGKDYSGTMLFTAAHELTHMIKAWNPQKFDVLADFLVEQYGKHGKSVADLVAAKKDLYAKNGKTISDELAFEEVIADSMEAMLQDGTVLAKLRQRDQTVWEKIRDYINQLVDKIRKAYGNLKPDSVEGQTVAAWTDVLEQIQDLFVDAVLEAGENYQSFMQMPPNTDVVSVESGTRHSYRSLAEAAGFTAVENEDGTRSFMRDGKSVKTVTVEDIDNSPIGALINFSLEKGDISAEDALGQKQMFAEICTMAAKSGDFAMSMQFMGSTVFTALKANADKQYGTTYDFPSICTKTQAVIDAMSAAMVREGRGLSTEEIVSLYRKTNELGNPVPCPECYVFSRWIGIGGLLDNIKTYQDRFGKMTPAQVAAEYRKLYAEIESFAHAHGLTFGKAKGAMTTKFQSEYKALKEKVETARNQGEKVKAEDQRRLDELESRIDTVKAISWIRDVYFADSSMTKVNPKWKVPDSILFDLNRGEEFARGYKAAWGFRTTQGAGYGKAITPYSEAVLGEGIMGTNNTSRTINSKARGTIDNTFLRQKGQLEKDAKQILERARVKQKIQAFLGGQRFQSTSDARYENASDYLLAALEMQAMGGMVQCYTKVDGAVAAFDTWGFSTNQSLMPKGGGLDANGKPQDTNVGGMNKNVAINNRKKFEGAGTITIGVNDNHIRAMFGEYFRDFIIPYHASGGKADVVAQFRTIQEGKEAKGTAVRSTDYSRTQGDKVLSDDVLTWQGLSKAEIQQIHARRDARIAILTRGKPDMKVVRGSRFLSSLYDKFNGGEWDGVKLPKGKVESQIFPNEFWDQTVGYDESGKITQDYLDYCAELGFLHRFSGMVPKNGILIPVSGYDRNGNRVQLTDLAYQYDADGNKTDEIEPFFWKVLTDRRMFGNDGKYLPQKKVTLSTTSADTVTGFARNNAGREYNKALADELVADIMGGKRFSLRAPVEQVGDLVASHGLSENSLKRMLKLGGMPMPSIAIESKAYADKTGELGHFSYGTWTVVFGKNTINPDADKNNRVYGSDVYTPTVKGAIQKGLNPDAQPEEYVRAMIELGRRAVGWNKSDPTRFAFYGTPEYKSFGAIKDSTWRLENPIDADTVLEGAFETWTRLYDDLAVMSANSDNKDAPYDALYEVAEAQMRGDDIRAVFKKHGVEVPDNMVADIEKMLDVFTSVPTYYFEAKPERVVRPDEWLLVVGPDDTDAEFIAELKEQGLNVKTYKARDNSSRLEVINSMPELRFSLRDPGQQKAAAQLQKENQKLREDIAKLKDLLKLQRTVTNGTKFTKTSIEAAAAKLIKDTGAKGTKAELAKLLETFYETIVQQKDPTLETVQEAAAPAAEWLAQHMEQGSVSAAEMMLAEQELIREVYDSYWSVSTLRTFADVKQAQINRLRGEHLKRMADLRAKHRAKVQELKAEHREALQRVKAEDRARLEAKLAEQRAQYQASRKESIESRHRTETRHKIQRVVKQLNDLLLHESKDKHVPERLKKVVTEALELFDMDTVDSESRLAKIDEEIAKTTDPKKIAELMETRKRVEAMGESFQARMEALENAYAEIRSGSDATLKAAFDPVIESKLAEAAEKVGNTKLRNMSMEQLEAVYDAYKMVLKSIRDANKAFKAGKNQTIVQMGEQAQEEIRKVGGEHETFAELLGGIKGFKWANLKPIYAMRTIGSDTLTKLFQNLRNGEDTWAKDIYEARDFFRQQRDKFHFDKWDMDKTYSFQSTTGKEFKLALQQIMSLYAYSRRHQADQHLYKGGFVFDSNTKVKRSWKGITYEATVNTAAAHNLTPEILADIVSKLTPEQKGFVESMQSYLSDVMGAKGNEVSMAMYDVRLFKEKNYFPLKSSKLFIYQQTEAAGEIKLKNSGFTKGTKPQAGNPIILQDFMDVWAGHVNDMSLYHAMVLPLEDFNRVLHYNGPNTADTDSVSVKTALQNAYGTQAYDYLSQMLKDINGGARADRDAHWINRWTTRFKKGATFASWSVVFQQPSAIARAFAVIDHKYFIGKRIDAKKHKAMWEEVKKYAGVAKIKEMGQFDVNMGRTTSEFITAKEYGTLTEQVKAMFADSGYRDEFFGRLPALADEVSWVTIWDAVKRETAQRNPGMNTHSEEFLTKAGERFTEVITLTQVYDSVLSRSQMMRSKDAGVKMATAFMAEPTTTVNMLADGILQTKRGNKKYFGKVLGAVVTSNLINSMLAAWVYAARDDDEEETYLEKYISSLVGKFFDSLNPLTYLPLLKDVVSIIQGYDVERSDMALFADIWNAWGKLDNKDYSAWRKVEDFAGSIAKVFGLPIQNIMRDLRGLWQVFAKSLPLAQGTAAGSRYAAKEGIWRWMGGGEVSNQQQLYDAYVSGDTAHANRVAARYKDQSAVETALRKALRENDPRIHEAALAKIAEDFGRYDELLSQIENEGHFVKRLIAGAVEAEINEILPDKERQSSTREKSYYDAEDFGIAFYHGDQEVIDMVRQDLVDTYVLNGKSLAEAEKAFQGDARSGIKEQYEAGAISDKEAVSGLVQYGGKTKEEAERLVREWRYTAETGHNHGDLKNNFISGRIDRKELISTLMTVNGYSREKATDQADQYEWERDYPELQDRITWAQYKKWRDNGKAGGVNFDTFIRVYDYRKNGGDTREWKEVESYINSLSLTDKQKDALWLSIYESEEKLKTLIWNR